MPDLSPEAVAAIDRLAAAVQRLTEAVAAHTPLPVDPDLAAEIDGCFREVYGPHVFDPPNPDPWEEGRTD